MKNLNVKLVIEKGETGLWGTVKYNNNLLVDSGDNLAKLENKFKTLLHEFENVNPETVLFEYDYY